MDLARPRLTRLFAALVDPVEEQRFRRYNLFAQRRTAAVSLVVILLADLVAFAVGFATGLSADDSATKTTLRIIVHLAAAGVGASLAIALVREKRHTRLLWLVMGAASMMMALTFLILATGPLMGYRGAILVVGGVAVAYLAVPLHLAAVSLFSLGFTVVALPIWIWAAHPGPEIDVRYTVMTVLLAHVLSFAEARRAQGERRVLFAQRETLRALSAVDPLTGLMNRRAVDAELEQAFRTALDTATPLSVLMVDIDHFKRLNDSQGHVAGDHALRLVADVIRSTMPRVPGQVAARYGGEEFICLLPGLDVAQAAVVAAQILRRVRRIGIPLTAEGSPQGRAVLTVSAGIGITGLRIRTPEELVEAADRQLYRAKADGRNCLRAEPLELAG